MFPINIFKKYPTLRTNTLHDVTVFEVDGMVENIKL